VRPYDARDQRLQLKLFWALPSGAPFTTTKRFVNAASIVCDAGVTNDYRHAVGGFNLGDVVARVVRSSQRKRVAARAAQVSPRDCDSQQDCVSHDSCLRWLLAPLCRRAILLRDL
jgi:hypothetical protein